MYYVVVHEAGQVEIIDGHGDTVARLSLARRYCGQIELPPLLRIEQVRIC